MAENLCERVRQIKEKWPGYGPLLDFYVAVREMQTASRPRVRIARAKTGNGSGGAQGFPRIGETGFSVDIESAVSLFAALCRLGKAANSLFATQAGRIEQAVTDGVLDLKSLLAGGGNSGTAAQAAIEHGLDTHVLSFLVLNSARPSIEVDRNRLLAGFESESWRQPSCPVCGSRPTLSLLKGDPAQRHSLCSYCGCQWRVDRFSCSACGNNDQDSLQCFYDEEDMTHRIDLCDRCHHYIKTIDCRALEAADPLLEDLATLHLDVVAARKGYARAVPSPWHTAHSEPSLT